MSIQISGGPYVKDTFTGSSGTAIRDGIDTALQAAGWSFVDQGGGVYDLTCPATPQGLDVVARLNTSGQVQFRNTAGTSVGSALGLTTSGSPTYTIIAHPYQFFVFVEGATSSGSLNTEFEVAGGVPFIPAFLTGATTECWWSMRVPSYRRNGLIAPAYDLGSSCFNGSMASGAAGATIGSIRWFPLVSAASGAVSVVTTWYDTSNIVCDPLIGFGNTLITARRVRGSLWDACVIMGGYTLDITDTFEGNNWQQVVNNITSGSLWLVIP